MGSAAAKNDITIQYCMSHVRHILQSVEIPAVTNARASGDYHPGNAQWQPLGTTGIFAWAVAIAPTKDNYWSTDIQTNSTYDDSVTVKEPYNRLEAAVSTLSKGPVAPSDKIGRHSHTHTHTHTAPSAPPQAAPSDPRCGVRFVCCSFGSQVRY